MGDMKYGFVYVWYDKGRKMFYVGCHWGSTDDRYICSSNRMRDAYYRRPEDFKRRVVVSNIPSRAELFDEEFKWLSLIDDEELATKYYNIRKWHANHWSSLSDARSIAKKSGDARRGRKLPVEADRGAKISAAKQAAKQKRLLETGSSTTEAQKLVGLKNRELRKGSKLSDAHKKAISEGVKKSRTPEMIESIASKNRGKRRKINYCLTCNVDTQSTRRQYCKDHRYDAMNKSRASKEGSKWYSLPQN